MIDLTLLSSDETVMMNVLRSLGLTKRADDGDSESISPPWTTSIYVIGTLYKERPPKDEDEEPSYQALDGWYWNVRTRDPELAAALSKHKATPSPDTPSYVWAD